MATTEARMQMRRDSAADWTSEDPTLAEGEWGFESDTRKFKVGDGTNAWSALDYSNPGLPAGLVSPYAATSAPSGWLACDGTGYSRTTYATLYGAIGATFGTSSTGTFKVPDMRGLFVRGSGSHGTMVDATTAAVSGSTDGVGGTQDDQVQGHWHKVGTEADDDKWAGYGTISGSGGDDSPYKGADAGNASRATVMVSDSTNGTPRTGAETRPANMTLLWIIKT